MCWDKRCGTCSPPTVEQQTEVSSHTAQVCTAAASGTHAASDSARK